MLVAISVAMPVFAQTSRDPLLQANSALQAGEADKVQALLSPLLHPGSAEAHSLECRVQYTLEHWDAAARECEEAVKLENQNSSYHLWLGRALGEKANRASFLTAFSLGKRVLAEFQEAVRLNPRNAEALADLGDFYKTAPGVVGGGLGRAEVVATQLDRVDPARARELRGRIAQERKDYGTAEREFKQAIQVGAHPAFQWVSLADFYRHQERWTEMESAIHSCVSAAEHDKRSGVALFDGASILTGTNRDLPLAAKMLESYLASYSKTEEAPAFVAHTRLARIKQQLGDTDGAKQEQTAALALARDYRPAQNLKFQETKH
jgi:tetratricopeptide (TPR) repeat protein